MDNRLNDNESDKEVIKEIVKEVISEDKEENKSKSRTRKRNIILKVYALLVTAVLGVFVCLSIYLHIEMKETDMNNEETTTEDNIEVSGEVTPNMEKDIKNTIKEYMENGKGTIEMLRELYPENVVVFDSNKYLFLPVNEKAAKNDIDNDNIKQLDNGELIYEKDNKQISHKGIDVSKYQGDIDWKKVAADGVEFAIIRIGYRGYGSGAIVLDETAIKNIEGAKGAGIKVGVYFFSQAITTKEAVEEAEFVIENIKKYDITYPVVFDTEEILNEDTRSEGLSVEERTDIAVAFCERIKKAGYTPAIYANLRWFTMSLDISKLESYDKWYAYYDKTLYFPYKISMWQYSESGQVDGINGSVDLNISLKDWE